MNRFDSVEKVLNKARKRVSSAEEEPTLLSKRFRTALDETCEQFSVELELEEKSKDEVYQEWQDNVNMSAGELKKWSRNPCSREASTDPVAVIKRNLRLLEKDKEDWTENDVEDAKRTISFISRMSDKSQRPESPREGPYGCPSEWAISLLNWAYNPFDSVPTPSSEVEKDLEPVDEVTLAELERKNIAEAERLAEPVWELKDHLNDWSLNFERLARELERTSSEERVEMIREELVASVDLMMKEVKPAVKEISGEQTTEEMQSNSSYEFEPVPDQVLYQSRGEAMSRARDLGLDGVHEHTLVFGDEKTTYYMPGESHREWEERVHALPDKEEEAEEVENREAEQVFHADQERHKQNLTDEEDSDGVSVDVQPTAIQKVEDGEVNDVESVLDDLWNED